MDIDLLTMSISVLAVAISVYAAVPYSEKRYTPIQRKPRYQLSPELQKLIGNVREMERRLGEVDRLVKAVQLRRVDDHS